MTTKSLTEIIKDALVNYQENVGYIDEEAVIKMTADNKITVVIDGKKFSITTK